MITSRARLTRVTAAALLATVMVAAGSAVTTSPAEAVETGTCESTPVVAHRGVLEGGATENSRRAVRLAIDQGLPFEVDLRETADDKIVLMHDRTIRRTTRGRGFVHRMRGRQIRRHKLDDGQTVPYAAGILRMVRDDPDAYALLELKALTPATQRKLRDLIDEYGIADRTEILSFRKKLIAVFRRLNPGIDTYLIITGPDLPTIATAARYGGVRVYVARVTPDWEEQMDALGIPFAARLDDTEESWDAAVRIGVTNIMTDAIPAYREWCEALSSVPVAEAT